MVAAFWVSKNSCHHLYDAYIWVVTSDKSSVVVENEKLCWRKRAKSQFSEMYSSSSASIFFAEFRINL